MTNLLFINFITETGCFSITPFYVKLVVCEIVKTLSFRIKELPRELGYLKNLKKLMIYKNELSEIPEEIGHCQALQVSI